MTEGVFPKIDGDVLYASEVNINSARDITNHICSRLSNDGVNIFTAEAIGSNLIGSTNVINQGGSVFPFFSADSSFNGVVDDHNNSSVGSLWIGSSWTSGGSSDVSEGVAYLNLSVGVNGNNTNRQSFASVTYSGTGLLNMFDQFGGYIRIRLGSIAANTGNDGTSDNQMVVSYDGHAIINKTGTGADQSFSTSGALIDLLKIGSNFYYKLNSGTAWQNWNGPYGINSGSSSLVFQIYTHTDDLTNRSVNMQVDWEHVISGTANSQFIYSGLLPFSISAYTGSTLNYTVVTMIGENISGGNLSVSLDGGVNYIPGTLNNWINVGGGGNVLAVKYTQSGNYGPGLTSAIINKLGAGFY